MAERDDGRNQHDEESRKATRAVWVFRVKKYGLRIGLAVFAVYVLVTFFIQNGALARQADELAKVDADIATAKQRQVVLMAKIEYQQTDEFIERYARDNLGFVKPGEIRFVDVSGQ